MTRIIDFMALMLAVCLASPGVAQDQPTGKQAPKRFAKAVTIQVEVDYLLYLPKEYGKGEKSWPLVLFLHGAGETGTDLDKVKLHGPPKLIAAGQDFPAIVVSPQARRFGWDPLILHALLDDLARPTRSTRTAFTLPV